MNIIHLDFKESIGFGDKSLFIIAESYSNLRYLNLWDAEAITDKGLCVIVESYCKLEHLNISYCRNITDKSLFEMQKIVMIYKSSVLPKHVRSQINL